MPEKTKVLYDVSQAVKELDKLDRKVTKSGKTAEQSLKKGGEGVSRFGDLASKVNPKVSALTAKIRGLAASAGPAGVAVAAIGGSAAVAAVAFTDLGGALRNADDTLGRFNEKAARSRAILDAISSTQDARRNVAFEDAKDAIVAQRGQIVALQNANDIRKEAAAKALSIERDKLSRLQSAFDAAARKTLSAEQRLADKRAELQGSGNEFGGQAKGRQVGSLTAKARQEAQKGNVDTAEALIERAKQLSAELGNHVFFTNQIDQANSSVLKALERDVTESKKKESALKQQASEQEQIVQGVESILGKENSRTRELARQLKLLGQQTAELSRQRKFERRLQAVDQGGRELDEAQAGLRGEISSQLNESDFRKGINVLTNLVKGVTDVRNLSTSGEDAAVFSDLENKITSALKVALKDNITPADVEQVGTLTNEAAKALADVKIGLDDGTLNKFGQQFADRSQPIVDALTKFVNAGGNLGATGLNESIPSAQARLRGQADSNQASASRIQSQITVNANVKGGAFDNDTLKQLTDTIRREVRKEVSKLQ